MYKNNISFFAGVGCLFFLKVYEKIKIYSEKFITNNSENKQEISYTLRNVIKPRTHPPGKK
jgi:hypothetical protein